MTSHWQRWVVHESIQETVESLTPSCTLRIFYPSHFPHSAFSTLRILHTPHFLHSSFSTLRKFYTQHSTYFTEPSSRYNFPHLSLCSALKSTTESNEKLSSGPVGSLSRIYVTILIKDLYFGPIARSSVCTADGREEMISCVLDYFRASPTQVF